MELVDTFKLYLKGEYERSSCNLIRSADITGELNKLYKLHKAKFILFLKSLEYYEIDDEIDEIFKMLLTGFADKVYIDGGECANRDIIHTVIYLSDKYCPYYHIPDIVFDACIKYMELRHEMLCRVIEKMAVPITDDRLKILDRIMGSNREICDAIGDI